MLEPDFDKGEGLLPAIVQDVHSGEVLMLAYMNREAYQETLSNQVAHFFSRSRQKLWKKGESSGHVQKVHSVRLDCDSDTILLQVEQLGEAACHKGYKSCFYREITADGCQTCSPLIFDPKEVYNK
ncbi:MAG: phosphoribosyl-AMP cyclohydrolase [Thermodesulfobacteriota bacterium]